MRAQLYQMEVLFTTDTILALLEHVDYYTINTLSRLTLATARLAMKRLAAVRTQSMRMDVECGDPSIRTVGYPWMITSRHFHTLRVQYQSGRPMNWSLNYRQWPCSIQKSGRLGQYAHTMIRRDGSSAPVFVWYCVNGKIEITFGGSILAPSGPVSIVYHYADARSGVCATSDRPPIARTTRYMNGLTLICQHY